MEAGFIVDALDLNVSGLNLDRVERIVRSERPRIVGISALTETYPNALAVARRVKQVDEGIHVVIGGAHATLLPAEALQERAVDFVVVGEGEAPMLGLARHLLSSEGGLEDVPGLAYRPRRGADDATMRLNRPARPLDPDRLPYPARRLFPLDMYRTPWTVLTARGGCPFRCPFCSSGALWRNGRKRVAREPGHVATEVRHLQDRHDAHEIVFVDDIFTIDKKWVYALTDRLGALQWPMRWTCATRVDLVDARLLSAMAAAGCASIQFGVESGSQEMLDSVKQRVRKEEVAAAVRAARAAGIEVLCSFMVPFPEDTEATLAETRGFIGELRALGSEISLSYTTPYPGTYFYDHADELGIRLLTRDWGEFDAKHNVIETRHLSAADIDRIVREIVIGSELLSSV